MLLSAVADAPARCMMLNFIQFNGNFGCPCCLAPGETLQVSDAGYSRIYPYNMDESLKHMGHHPIRTHSDVIDTGRRVQQEYANSRRAEPEPVQGIKGMSALSSAPRFDTIRGTTVDYMHCCLLGIVKMLLTLWFDVKHRNTPWSLRKHQQLMDMRLLSVKPPNFIHRLPRGLEDVGQWKASELRSFLLFFSVPVLQGYLPKPYLMHLGFLVQAVYLLIMSSISSADIRKAKKLLKAFCLQIEDLYGARYQTFNVHSLLHLTDKVVDLGPLWCHSCFFFEDLNGDLRSLFHGTANVHNQVMVAVCCQQMIPELRRKITDHDEAAILHDSFVSKQKLPSKCEQVHEKTYIVGKMNVAELGQKYMDLIEEKMGPVVEVEIFYRLLHFGIVMHSMRYSVVKRRNNYTIMYNESSLGFVDFYLACKNQRGKKLCVAVVKKLEIVPSEKAVVDLLHMKVVKTSHVTEVIPVSAINGLCIFISMPGEDFGYVSLSPNIVEKE